MIQRRSSSKPELKDITDGLSRMSLELQKSEDKILFLEDVAALYRQIFQHVGNFKNIEQRALLTLLTTIQELKGLYKNDEFMDAEKKQCVLQQLRFCLNLVSRK